MVGYHTLRLYCVDTGVIIDKIVINVGNKVEYFGPSENYR
ncbi:MAG: hypothetical protein GX288_10405 [Clostridiales bacterium]|nr:hypothetical protein [Clostridiales bacterium]